MSVPLSGVKRKRVVREQAHELNKKIVSKYIPQVKAQREADYHDFTTADKLRGGNAVNLQ